MLWLYHRGSSDHVTGHIAVIRDWMTEYINLHNNPCLLRSFSSSLVLIQDRGSMVCSWSSSNSDIGFVTYSEGSLQVLMLQPLPNLTPITMHGGVGCRPPAAVRRWAISVPTARWCPAASHQITMPRCVATRKGTKVCRSRPTITNSPLTAVWEY